MNQKEVFIIKKLLLTTVTIFTVIYFIFIFVSAAQQNTNFFYTEKQMRQYEQQQYQKIQNDIENIHAEIAQYQKTHPQLRIFVNGEQKEIAQYAYNDKQYFLPVRWLAEQLHYNITWNNDTKTAQLQNQNNTISFTENDNHMLINGNRIKMEYAAMLSDGSLLVPIPYESSFLKTAKNNDTNALYIIEPQRILYENKTLGIGVLIPEGYQNNCFKVTENNSDTNTILQFFDSEGEMLIFSLWYGNLDYWEKEVKPTFSIPYTEVCQNNNNILLCVNASDVPYDSDAKKANYETLLQLKQKICDSVYFFTE